MSELSDKIRREFKKSDDVRDAGLTTPDYVERYDDIVYGDTDPAMQVLDVYRPQEFLYYGRKGSNLGHVFHLNMKLAIAHECNERECAFFRSWMNREA